MKANHMRIDSVIPILAVLLGIGPASVQPAEGCDYYSNDLSTVNELAGWWSASAPYLIENGTAVRVDMNTTGYGALVIQPNGGAGIDITGGRITMRVRMDGSGTNTAYPLFLRIYTPTERATYYLLGPQNPWQPGQWVTITRSVDSWDEIIGNSNPLTLDTRHVINFDLDSTRWDLSDVPWSISLDQFTIEAPDTDGDGINDICDNCATTPNADQADLDGDGIGDSCDTCPNDPGDDADGDGLCPDVDNCPSSYNPGQEDTDADGVGDACDNCPLTSNADQADINQDGVGDGCDDTDGDGLLDATELEMGSGCPNVFWWDTDWDSLSDGAEVALGTNPCSWDSDADGVGDAYDPLPTEPGVTGSWLEDSTRTMATSELPAVELYFFTGPTANAQAGRRNALINRAANAANAIAAGDYVQAIRELESLLDKIDGVTPPPDWILDDSWEKWYLADRVHLLITLLEYLAP
jgi:hypothetical protein